MPLILNDISKSFSGKKQVLKNVNIELQKGELIGLIGPNGAGKTTLMKIISGLIVNYEGEIENKDIKDQEVSNLIEEPKFFPSKSGLYNIKYFSKLFGTEQSYVDSICSKLKIDNDFKKKARKLSLGMKQRLGIALALLSRPDYLILDEPISGMDPNGVQEILNHIRELSESKGVGILISSHALNEIQYICDNIYLIEEGSITSQYTRDKHYTNHFEFHFKHQDFEQSYNVLKEIGEIEQKQQNWVFLKTQYNAAEIFALLNEYGIQPEEFEKNENSLKEFYFNNLGEK